MSKKIIAGVLSLILTVSSMGADVFAQVSADPADGDNEAVAQETVDADTAAEDEEAVSDEEKQTGTYTICFDPNEGTGSLVPDMYCEREVEYELPECTYTREGYVFVGWNKFKGGSYKDDNHYNPGDMVKNLAEANDVITLWAIWALEYGISYELDGGVNDKDNPVKYNVATLPVIFKDPVKDFYKFDGWYDDAQFTTKITQLGPGTTGNKQLYAKWVPYKYSVKFDGNGSTGGSTPEMAGCEYDRSYNLTANGFVKKGYDFTGWNTKADGTGTAYADKASVKNLSGTDGGVITFYAQWKKETYTITYNLDGGENDPANPSSYNIDSDTITLKDATRKGYAFEGWYSDSSFKNKVTEIASGSTGDKVFYAKWKMPEYTLTYNLNGGENDPANPSSYNKNSKTITLKDATRKGYAFEGWYSDSSFKNKVTEIASGSTGDKVFYAKWKANTYTVRFKGNGATSGKMSVLKNRKYGSEYTLGKNKFKRKGYTFTGWNTKANGKGKSYSNKANIKDLTSKDKATVTFYAQWKIKKYKIKYVLNKGKNDKKNPKTYNIKTKTIKLQPAKRKGYTFTGWYSDRSFKHKVTKIKKGNTGNKTLYAKWKVNK